MNSLGLEDELFRAVEDYNTRAVGLSGSVTPGSGWDTALNRPYKRAMATGFLKGRVACDGQRAGNSVPVRK
jgi:hypothetical protein